MFGNNVLLAEGSHALSDDAVRILQGVAGGLLVIVVLLGLCLVPFLIWRGRVRRRGYRGLKEYLRELPQTDAEKLDAVELTLKGVVICLLGLLFPPILVYGLVPLYFGTRKLAGVRLGIKDADEGQREGRLQ
jgi:hypothetical protein